MKKIIALSLFTCFLATAFKVIAFSGSSFQVFDSEKYEEESHPLEMQEEQWFDRHRSNVK